MIVDQVVIEKGFWVGYSKNLFPARLQCCFYIVGFAAHQFVLIIWKRNICNQTRLLDKLSKQKSPKQLKINYLRL
jgi:hypothetical protein